jgi:hypothetical protein
MIEPDWNNPDRTWVWWAINAVIVRFLGDSKCIRTVDTRQGRQHVCPGVSVAPTGVDVQPEQVGRARL